jgi:ActR/RegA family two-component response regulator
MGVSLLIAEPDRMLQTTLAQFFAGEGFYVQTVGRPDVLANRLRNSPPAVVLLEPELLGGHELTGVTPVPTVVLTRHTGPTGPLPACFAVVASFSKPAVLRDVTEALRRNAETAVHVPG